MYQNVELHLGPDPSFCKRHGRRVKAAGGKYREVRGHASVRFVNVPASDPTLINVLCETYGCTTLIARDFDDRHLPTHPNSQVTRNIPAWVHVFTRKYDHRRDPHPAEQLFAYVASNLVRWNQRIAEDERERKERERQRDVAFATALTREQKLCPTCKVNTLQHPDDDECNVCTHVRSVGGDPSNPIERRKHG